MRLKELRIRAKKTQKEIAEMLNMSQTGYNSYETERTEPDIEVLKKLSKYYNETIDYLVGNDLYISVNDKDLTETQENIVNHILEADEIECQTILVFIESLNYYKKAKKT